MKQKTKVILSSALTMTMCASLIAGSTFALFTSKSDVNVAITSGKVAVKASVENLKGFSAEWDETSNKYTEKALDSTETSGTFTNGGTFGYKDGALSLDKITPGDKVSFDVKITNESTVNMKYQMQLKGIVDKEEEPAEGEVKQDLKLLNSLTATVKESEESGEHTFKSLGTGTTFATPWSEVIGTETKNKTVNVSIEMPIDTDDTYQNLGCTLVISVYAIQGNANTVDLKEGSALGIYSANDMKLFSQMVSEGNDFDGETVELMNDIDLSGRDSVRTFSYVRADAALLAEEVEEWNPIGTSETSFKGTFEGNDYTIYGLHVSGASAGLFGVTENATIENLTIADADVTAINGEEETKSAAGILVGTAKGTLTLENVKIENSSVQAEEGVENATVGALVGTTDGEDAQVTVHNAEVETEEETPLVGFTPYGSLETTDVTVKDETGTEKEISCTETGLHDYDPETETCKYCGAMHPFVANKWGDGEYMDEGEIDGCPEGITNLVIPGYINGRPARLSTSAFQGNKELRSVVIGEGVTKISGSSYSYGWGAFKNCTNLHEVTLPSSITEIGAQAFYGCSYMTEIHWPKTMNGNFTIGSEAFYNCGALEDLIIPEGCTSIGGEAFYHAELEYLVLPTTLKSLGNNAFEGCQIHNLDLSKTEITYIPEEAFAYNRDLTKVTLPEKLTGIDSEAFYGCAFDSIVIPASVTSLGSECLPSSLRNITFGSQEAESKITRANALRYCWNLEKITFYGTKQKWESVFGTILTSTEESENTVKVEIIPNNGNREVLYYARPED